MIYVEDTEAVGDVRRVGVVVVLYWAQTVLVPIATRTYLAGLVEIPRIPVLFLVGLLSGRRTLAWVSSTSEHISMTGSDALLGNEVRSKRSPKTGAGHQHLNVFVGTWNTGGQQCEGPVGPAAKIRGGGNV